MVAGMAIDASSYLRAHSRSPSPDPTLAVHADRGPSTCLQEELADSVSLPPGVCPTAPRATSQLNLSVVLSFEPLPCDGISLVSLSHSTRRDAAHACSQPHHPAAAPSLGPRPLPHSGLLPPRPPAGSRDPTARPCRSSSRVRAPTQPRHTARIPAPATRRPRALLASQSPPLATTERALPNGGGYEISVGSDPRYFVSLLVAAAAAEAARPTFFPPHRPPSGHFSPLLTLGPPPDATGPSRPTLVGGARRALFSPLPYAPPAFLDCSHYLP